MKGGGESDYYSTEAEGNSPAKRPADLWSILESRPSTAQNSDYYSQPASPQVVPMKALPNAKLAGPFSARANLLVNTNSTTDLRKRISILSMSEGLPDLPISPGKKP